MGLEGVATADLDWASSDRVVLAGQDGAVRLAGLALAGTASPAHLYGREYPPCCPALLPGPTQRILGAAGCRGTDLAEVETLARAGAGEYAALLEGVLGAASWKGGGQEASLVQGLGWQAELLRLAGDCSVGSNLFPFLADRETFLTKQQEAGELERGRAASRSDRARLTAQLICMVSVVYCGLCCDLLVRQGQTEEATSLLLDTEVEEDRLADQLLACLLQATHHMPCKEAIEPTMKLVATRLVAEGRVWEGVQLLVLAGKPGDACNYLRAAGLQEAAVWVRTEPRMKCEL